jgi:hypothetical protein
MKFGNEGARHSGLQTQLWLRGAKSSAHRPKLIHNSSRDNTRFPISTSCCGPTPKPSAKEGVEELINLQRDGKSAKPYQVKQVRRIMLRYGLGGDD